MLPYGYLLFATQFYDACGLEVQTTIKPPGGEALKGLYSHWPVSKTWGGKASQVGPGLRNDVYEIHIILLRPMVFRALSLTSRHRCFSAAGPAGVGSSTDCPGKVGSKHRQDMSTTSLLSFRCPGPGIQHGWTGRCQIVVTKRIVLHHCVGCGALLRVVRRFTQEKTLRC